MRKKRQNIFIFLLMGWILGTALFGTIGYCIAGAINAYKPIGMLLGIILCEVVFAIILFLMNRKLKENEADTESEYGEFDTLEKKIDVESLFQENVSEASAEDAPVEELEVDVMLQEETFLELFSNGYSMQQIKEMMELTKYIKNLDVPLLKKMFKPSMSPEEIRRHIESFYG